jgi:cellulose synthase/poly-beta-1,6-N-acetylglucosamine synthase-like glycosyltransferase
MALTPETTGKKPIYDYARFSQLAGPFAPLPKNKPYKVGFKRLSRGNALSKALILIMFNLLIEVGFLVWLLRPSHLHFSKTNQLFNAGIIAILFGIITVEGFRIINMFMVCLSTVVARNPIPVRPPKDLRVAFTTAIVPSKEPFEVVERTLKAAKKMKYQGKLDIWLLDEGNVPEIKAACDKMGVHHFSRNGIDKYNTEKGAFKAKTKHGNHNAWLDTQGHNYDIVLSVDLDHVPQPNFVQRMLGYFRDPDVAFVVGPQVYSNYAENAVTKGAESQAYLFQAAIQRAGNAYNSPMFVGTNNAYRVSTWQQIGGFQDSITEDMLTSMVVHASRNPLTNNKWKSVYTPDVVAVGEGPNSWTDFYSQQLRWARGSNEIVLKNYWKLFFRLPTWRRMHYTLMVTYYPSVAISWVFGIMISMVYLVMGHTGVHIPGAVWLALYTDVIIAQLILYTWLRRYNVSPHEEEGSLGVPGILITMVTIPIYVTALASTILRRKLRFVVTPKGQASSPDTWQTFRKHLFWATIITEFLVYSFVSQHSYPGVKIWSAFALTLCLLPIISWQIMSWPQTKTRIKVRLHQALPTFYRIKQSEDKSYETGT